MYGIKQVYWPKGTYSMVAPRFGCPEPVGEWVTGARYSGLDNDGAMSPGLIAVADVAVKEGVLLNFCTKNGQFSGAAGNGSATWPKGSYCLFKRLECPRGFYEGYFKVKGIQIY